MTNDNFNLMHEMLKDIRIDQKNITIELAKNSTITQEIKMICKDFGTRIEVLEQPSKSRKWFLENFKVKTMIISTILAIITGIISIFR